MKNLIFAVVTASTICAFGADAEKTKDVSKTEAAKPAVSEAKPESSEAELEKNDAPIFWAFANYGFYSGYQLYGSIVNTEPTLQGYCELNANLPWEVGPLENLGYFGGGMWNNSDLTGKRNASLRRAFNEFDWNVHWGKTFWIDDNHTWGVDYRTSVVWYFYPHTGANRPNTKTTMDWNHSFAILNPYVVPFLDVVHEYEQSEGTLLQFGLRRDWTFFDSLTLTPSVTFVWRSRDYGWCFSNFGEDAEGNKLPCGLATMKWQLDATYMFTKNIGIFAKVAICTNLDDNLRDAADYCMSDPYGYYGGAAYGRYNEFCWGGCGITVSF